METSKAVKIVKEKFTTIYVPISLHKKLASIVLEQSLKLKRRVHIWEYIENKIKNNI